MSAVDVERRALQRQGRIVLLLDAAARAGVVPVPVIAFHAFAFLSNVLAPVWSLAPLDGKLLKRKGGPFYPELQHDVDRMVGTGMVTVRGVTHLRGPDRKWRLEGSYELHYPLAKASVDFLRSDKCDDGISSFLLELAYALSALNEVDLARALVEDATYADPSVSDDNVLDFDEWARRNPSANASSAFDRFMPGGTKATPGERLHLYVRHLYRRLHG